MDATLWLLLIALGLCAAVAIFVLARRRRTEVEAPSASPAEVCPPPPTSRYIEIDGLKVHFTQAGQGPDIVLLHGIGASIYVWRFLFPLLQSKLRVTAIDLPGFGKSTKDAGRDYGLDSQSETVARAIGAIGITNATLVGSSMGGAIALWLAKRRPENFASVIAIAPATDRRLVPALADSMGSMTPVFWRALNRRSMRVILSRVLRRGELITDECVDAYLEPFREGADSLKTFWASLSLLKDKRLPEDFKGMSARVLILYGERDAMVPRASIDKLLTLLPSARFHAHSDGGHHVMEDEPVWTAEKIFSFVEIPTPNKP